MNEAHRVGLTLEHYVENYDENKLNYNGYSMGGITYSNAYTEDTNDRTRVSLDHQWLMNSLLVDESKISLSYQDSSALNKTMILL